MAAPVTIRIVNQHDPSRDFYRYLRDRSCCTALGCTDHCRHDRLTVFALEMPHFYPAYPQYVIHTLFGPHASKTRTISGAIDAT